MKEPGITGEEKHEREKTGNKEEQSEGEKDKGSGEGRKTQEGRN